MERVLDCPVTAYGVRELFAVTSQTSDEISYVSLLDTVLLVNADGRANCLELFPFGPSAKV
jgi:hypothetical protein